MRRTSFTSLAAGLLVLAFAAAPSFAADFDPHNFDVQMQGGPDMQGGAPTCTQDETGAQVCTSSFDYTETGKHMTGTVRERGSGLSGTIETTCDWDMHMRHSFRFGTTAEVLEFSGSGSHRCSWFMDFEGGSSLAGTISGTMRMGLVNGTTGFFGGTFTVVVVAGTGEFEGMVGTGVFEEYEEFPLVSGEQAPPQPPPPTSECFDADHNPIPCPSVSAARTLAAAAGAQGSKMKLQLRKGRPLARIASPGPRLKAASKASLRVVAAPGSSCRAVARNGERRVDLGSASDRDRDGLVAFPGRLALKLRPGMWTLTASCAYELDGARGTATTARSLVRLA